MFGNFVTEDPSSYVDTIKPLIMTTIQRIRLGDLAARLGCELHGDPDIEITGGNSVTTHAISSNLEVETDSPEKDPPWKSNLNLPCKPSLSKSPARADSMPFDWC